MKQIEKAVSDLINEVNIFMISSVDSEGFPNTKAMLSPRKREGIKMIYFTTALSSMKAVQFSQNSKANIYFCNASTFKGVMLMGTMEVLTDVDLKEEMWREGDELYHPLGITDPDYCILKFTTQKGRFYSQLSSENFILS